MKHFIRDILISVIAILGISFVYRVYTRRKGPLARVIVFHDVADKVWFESVIKMLTVNYHVVTPEQFHTQDFNTKKINILVTFDDGYQSWIDTCLPALKQYNIKGLFFVNSGLLDIYNDTQKVSEYMKNRLRISPKASLSWQGAEQLLHDGHSIGGHSVSHYNLALLSPDELQEEIVEDKQKIESMLNMVCTDFAYPFGQRQHWNQHVQEAVLKAGYTFVYTASSGFAIQGKRQEIARVCLEKNQSVQSINKWIKGGYDIFSVFK